MTLWIGLHKYLLLVGKILSQHQKQQKNTFEVCECELALKTSYSNSSAFLQSHVKLQLVFRQGKRAPFRADL